MRRKPSFAAFALLLLCVQIIGTANAEQRQKLALPDDGPRYDSPLTGPDGELFSEGVTAFQQDRAEEAGRIFGKLIAEFPASPLADASQAFLADLTAKAGTDHHGRQAVEAYRALIHRNPASLNASRARWRIGDLYAEGRWFIEAKAAYEQALAESPGESARALLGLGTVLSEGMQWKDAERVFRQLIGGTDDERLLALATFGLADALARMKRWEEARAVYEAGSRRWSAALKLRPESLLLFAQTHINLDRSSEARTILEQFYNLHPAHPEAPAALIRVGDSWRQVGRASRAKTMYAAVVQKHPGTYEESVARMRLAELDLLQDRPDFSNAIKPNLDALLEGRGMNDVEPQQQENLLRHLAQAYASVALGSEALFHLGEYMELLDRRMDAVDCYRQLSDRKGTITNDPWPEAAGRRLRAILSPWIAAALRAHDDLAAVILFYRHGTFADDLYGGQPLLLEIAAAHQRLGFLPQAIKLYQTLVRETAPEGVREQALAGLGSAYLDQQDVPAARRVFERALLQYPMGRSRPLVLRHLAETLKREGDWNGVVRICRLWLRQADAGSSPEHRPIFSLLAGALVELGQTREALEIFARTISAAGSDANAARLRDADRLLRAGRHDEAATRYADVIRTMRKTTPADAEWARFQLAKIRRTQKRYREARTCLESVRATATDELVMRIADALLADLPQTGGNG